MNYEILEALGQIAREKAVDKELVIATLEAGIVSAARRRYGPKADIRVTFDDSSGSMKIEYVRKVVDDLTDEELEIEIDDARMVDPKAKLGEELRVPLSLEDFGRNAIQAAKQVVVQRVREAERDNVYQMYHERVGEIITGTVQQLNRGNMIVNLGRAEALLPWREQIRREQYRQGDTVRAMIIEVQKNAKGPQVILSRASENFLRKLFEQEVPEIQEGIVTIKAVAREAGGRSKIAVASNEYRVDPVGACVGMKGSRVQGIVRELSGERIDIVPYSEDPIAFVTKALSPAKILQTVPDEENRLMKVIVTEDQLSLAIGKSGQNARLAAKLTGWEIDLVSEEEFALSRGEKPRRQTVTVDRLEGLGPKMVENLIQSGFETVEDIVKATMEELMNVPGIGDVTAQKIYLSAVQYLEHLEAEKAKESAAPGGTAPLEAELAFVAEVPGEAPSAAELPGAGATATAVAKEVSSAPAPETRVEPRARREGSTSENYLADIEAMESELTSGWTEAAGKPEGQAESAKDDDTNA
jgi:N utilization substance protein A